MIIINKEKLARKISILKYFFLSSVKNLIRNATATIFSLVMVAVAFFILGLFILYLSIISKNSSIIFSENEATARIFRYIGYLIYIVIPLVLILFIVNSSKMNILNRKDEIKVMKLIGATNGFIQWIFIIEGIFIGIMGSFIGVLLLYIIYSFSYNTIMLFITEFNMLKTIFVIKNMFYKFELIAILIIPFGNIFVLRKGLRKLA